MILNRLTDPSHTLGGHFPFPTRSIVSLLVLLMGLGGLHAEESADCEGRVLDAATGQGIAGARVEIEKSEVTSTTDPAGRFRLERLPRPEEVLLVMAVGYGSRAIAAGRLPFSGPISIQLRAAPSTLREHVVVTPTRTPSRLSDVPGSVTVMDRRDLSTTPTSNLIDALSATPGLHGFSPWGNPQDFGLNVRGFTGAGFTSYLVVLVDGAQVNDVDSGLVDWNLLPLDRISRVEIQRGPASALYGDTGLGGVVHLFTDTAGPDPATSLSLIGGEHGETQGGIHHAGGSERIGYSISGSHREFEGFRDRSEWDSDTLTGKVRLKIGPRSDLVLSTIHHRLENESPGPLSEAQVEEDRTRAGYPFDEWERDRDLFAAGYRYRGAGGMELSVDLSHRLKDSEQILTLPLELQSGASLMPVFDVKQQVLDARATALHGQAGRAVEWGGTRHHLLAGLEAGDSDLSSRYRSVDGNGDPGAVVADGRGSRGHFALYLQDQIAEVGPLSLSLGVRYDRFDDEFEEDVAAAGDLSSDNDAISPKLGMTWSYRPDGDLFVQASRGFRAPTLEQLFDQRQPFGSLLSNGELEPQKSTNYEIGIRQSFSKYADLEVSLYSIRLRNEIEFDPATFQFSNIGRSRHQGAEFFLTGHLSPKLDAFLSYTFQDATHENGAAPGKQIIFVPRHLGSAGIRFGLDGGWVGSLVFRAVGRQFLDDFNRHAIHSYATLDAQIGYRWEQIELFVAGLNLTDEEYATNGFITPRSVIVPGPSLAPTMMNYPAPPRGYRAGLRLKF
jgi:iron complex outermembrane receptor protein